MSHHFTLPGSTGFDKRIGLFEPVIQRDIPVLLHVLPDVFDVDLDDIRRLPGGELRDQPLALPGGTPTNSMRVSGNSVLELCRHLGDAFDRLGRVFRHEAGEVERPGMDAEDVFRVDGDVRLGRATRRMGLGSPANAAATSSKTASARTTEG